MKRTGPRCQLVAPSASQWDGKAFVLGGNLRSALRAAQARLCTCKHVRCFGMGEAKCTIYIPKKEKKKLSYMSIESLILLCVHHRTFSASLNSRDFKGIQCLGLTK